MSDNTRSGNIEVRLADMAGEIRTMGLEVRNLVKLVEKDVSVLRKDHDHLKENHKALDQSTTALVTKLNDEIKAAEQRAIERTDELSKDVSTLKATVSTEIATLKTENTARNRLYTVIGMFAAAIAAFFGDWFSGGGFQ